MCCVVVFWTVVKRRLEISQHGLGNGTLIISEQDAQKDLKYTLSDGTDVASQFNLNLTENCAFTTPLENRLLDRMTHK